MKPENDIVITALLTKLVAAEVMNFQMLCEMKALREGLNPAAFLAQEEHRLQTIALRYFCLLLPDEDISDVSIDDILRNT